MLNLSNSGRLLRSIFVCLAITSLNAFAQTPAPAVIRIHAGGAAVGSWLADTDFSASQVSSTTAAIVTTLVPNPAPRAVYQSERYGDFTYTIPNLTPGLSYPVNLHFAEIYWNAAHEREFNVSINGAQVLTNFDIFASAGGMNIALTRQFTAVASPSGTITIQFTSGAADLPKVSGIEVMPPLEPVLNSGAVYTVVSDATGQALDDNNTTTPGGVVTQWSPTTGNTNQQWQINTAGNGQFTLASLSNGLALDNAGSTTAGAQIAQNVATAGKTSQIWTITPAGSGVFVLKNSASGLVLDTGNSSGNGGTVVQSQATNAPSQMWKITPVTIGAQTPFVSYEGEAGTLGGGATVVSLTAPPTTMFASPQLEASGRAFAQLTETGQSVSWTNNTGHAITAINVRYSIPDAPNGGGITSTLDLYVNGALRQALSVNSTQSWVYETQAQYDGQSNNPADGVPHKFWDETHAFITGAAVQPGDTIMLQKDTANSAAFYNIDVVDLEAPPAPLPQPANSLSITSASCGAVANNINVDSAPKIQTCMALAKANNQILWIPQGTFYLNTSLNLSPNQITVEGAGMWYSTIYFNPPFPYANHDNVLVPFSSTIRNLHIDGNATSNTQDAYAINMKGSNWLIDSVWVEHEGPGVWADGMNGTVSNSRLDSLWADGINLNNGSGAPDNDGGTNLTALDNFIRGSGDDGMAINSAEDGTPQQTPMMNTMIINNTIVGPWWANGIGIYGGTLDLVANNLVTDSVKEAGIGAGTFGPQGTPLQTAFISGNTILRGGSLGYGSRYPAINIGQTGSSSPNRANNVIARGNTIINPMFNGVLVNSTTNTEIFNNTVNAPTLVGFEVGSGNGEAVDFSPAQGNASFFGNTVYNLAPGQTAFSLTVPGFSATQQNDVGPVNP